MQTTAVINRLKALPALARVGIVAGGYAAAMLVAIGAVAVLNMLDSGTDRDASSGMAAFGDAVLFIAVFGALAMVPTALAVILFFRRSRV